MVQNYDGIAISQLGNIYSIRKDTKNNNNNYIIIIIIIINCKECLPMQYCSYRLVIFPSLEIALSKHQILQTYSSFFEQVRVPRSLPRCSYGKNYCET